MEQQLKMKTKQLLPKRKIWKNASSAVRFENQKLPPFELALFLFLGSNFISRIFFIFGFLCFLFREKQWQVSKRVTMTTVL